MCLFICDNLESTSSADCEDAEKQIPAEVNQSAFVEPLPGIKPSEAVKLKDLSTHKLEPKGTKGPGDVETRKGQIESQAASSAGQSSHEPLKKTEPSKKKPPGRIKLLHRPYS